MKRWIRCELHTHSYHSDGAFNAVSLLDTAEDLGIQALAATDHNSNLILETLLPEAERRGFPLIPGVELSTFFGHLLVMGVRAPIDWRDMSMDVPLDAKLREIHALGGINGIAHPFRPASPLCNGGLWRYEVEDCSNIDYIEVWSGIHPMKNPCNAAAMDLWDDWLNQGHRVTGLSGRDWHKPGTAEEDAGAAFSYLQVEGEISVPKLMDSIRKGDVSVAIYDLPVLNIENRMAMVSLISEGRGKVNLSAVLCVDGKRSDPLPVFRETPTAFSLPEKWKWVRVELYDSSEMVGFTNPTWADERGKR